MASSHNDELSCKPTIVVLGGGSTGLGTGLGVTLNTNDRDVFILEKNAKPGGLAGSFLWNGHTIDFGPHRLSPNLESVRILAKELLGPDCLINKSQHGVQFKGRLYQFPPRAKDWINPFAVWHLIVFGLSFFVSKLTWITHRFNRESFESTMIAKFGKAFYHSIVAPMSEKVWTPPNEIDPAFVNQRFALIQPTEVIKKVLFPKQELNPSLFYYPAKGFQQLWDNLADYLERDGQRVLYQTWPTELEVSKNQIVRVAYKSSDGKTGVVAAEKLDVVSTIPLIKLLEIVKGVDMTPLIEKGKKIKFRSMHLVALEFKRPKTLPFRTLIFPEKAFCFNRLFEQNEYSRETVTANKSVVVADITFQRGDAQGRMTDEEIIAAVTRDLGRLSYIPLNDLTNVRVERVEFAYTVPNLESRRCFYEIQHELKKIRNLFLVGRFSVGEYDNSDYAIDSGLALGAMLSGRASKLDYLMAINSKSGRNIVG